MKSRSGIFGILAAAIFFAAAAVSAAAFEDGVFSPFNCFVTELGAYTREYMAVSPALVFNAGMTASGLLLCIFMIMYGIRKNSPLYTATSFMGVLCGMIMAAQGVFTLNFPDFHHILTGALSASIFAACLLHIISEIRSSSQSSGLAGCIAAFFAGAASVVFFAFTITGGVGSVLAEDLSGAARRYFMPFAVVQWASYVLLFIFISIVSVKTLIAKGPAARGKDGNNIIRNSGIEL